MHCWGQALVEIKGCGQDWDVKDLVGISKGEHLELGEALVRNSIAGGLSEWEG